jgi:mannose/fructose/N-acetylgalactosamine-specific phosphotransferase system component IID
MQYLGFLYSIAPGMRKIGIDSSNSHMIMNGRFFNTQPYLAPTSEGILLYLAENNRIEDAARLVQPVSSSLAALGDSLFWAVLKPVACLLCLISALSKNLWGILVVLVVYNIAHLGIMIWGFWEGYKNGPQGAFKIGKAISAERSGALSLIIPFLCGFCVILAPEKFDDQYFIALPLLIMSAVALYNKVNFMIIFYGIFILMLLMTIIL